ncbi:hypothetical protein L6R53_16510 [Myxococcota bacterium]|nr:hypothetical protein [Myxococcota bacterium]
MTLPGTHNSMSNQDDGWLPPNQQHGLTAQLQDGVRALMLDTHYGEDGSAMLCHAECALGSQPLSEGLGELADFLDAHPREVLVVLFEDYVTPEDTVAAIELAGLADRAIPPPADGDWPTLQALIDADTRVLFTAQGGGGAAAWYAGAWDLFYDTPYSFETAADFTCDLNRGSPDNAFFLVNHWLSAPISLPEFGEEVNQQEVLLPRVEACAAQWGRPVSFVGVDFYAVGDLFSVVDRVNGVAPATTTR